jgi:predicted DNA-binding transcriptional regulator AlpA
MSTETLERLLTQEELAERLQVKMRTVQTWRYQGKGPKVTKLGPLVRYRPRDVEAWLDEIQSEDICA